MWTWMMISSIVKKKNYIKTSKPSNNWPTGTRPNPFRVIVLAYTKANPILKQTGLASLKCKPDLNSNWVLFLQILDGNTEIQCPVY